MIEFRYPFLLLLLIPGVWAAWRAVYRWGIPGPRPARAIARLTAHHLPVLLVILLVLAAAGPEWRRAVAGRAPVVDFAVVLDGSSSMKALDDGKQDRWTVARNVLRAFIAGRGDDRFALVLFSAHPVTLSPLTADKLRLWAMLGRLELDSRDDGTAIGSALMTAVRRLQDSPARSRVILLLTDGAQNRGRVTGLEAAEEARINGIRIHTVAIGSTGKALYPFSGGGLAEVHVETDPATLKQISDLTGGEAFHADDPAGLIRSFTAIDQLETTSLPVDAPTEGVPLGKWLMLAAAALALPFLTDLAFKRGRPRPAWLEA